MSQTLANQAASRCNGQDAPDIDGLHEFLRVSGFEASVMEFRDRSHAVDLMIFADGSGVFCGASQAGSYLPLPSDPGSDTHPEDFLPASAARADISGRPPRRWRAADSAPLATDFADHIADHPDPPEALRSVILEPSRPFTWEDPGSVATLRTTLALAVHLLDPAAREVVLHAASEAGRSRIQAQTESDAGHLFGPGADLLAPGAAFAEITDSDDPERMMLAADPLAWLSSRLLARQGRPVGWSLADIRPDTDRRPVARLSGFKAIADSIILELEGALSNHLLLRPAETLAVRLRQLGLLSSYRSVLARAGLLLDGTPCRCP